MHILKATILKDVKILLRDRVGLFMMFFMPILLVIVITTVQNSTFELVNNNKVSLIIYNHDKGLLGNQLVEGIQKIGLFRLTESDSSLRAMDISSGMHKRNALVAIVIPENFTLYVRKKADEIASRSLKDPDSISTKLNAPVELPDSLLMYYHPVMQTSFRQSIEGALRSAVQVIQGEAIVKKLYEEVNQKELPPDLEKLILFTQLPISEIPVSWSGSRTVPNASQHNVPAWTIFAMFFIVISLGGAVVREKNSGSFIRLKTLPASYMYAIFSKQIVYLMVTTLQAAVIFAIGNKIFPFIGLPVLHLPHDILGLRILCRQLCHLCWCILKYDRTIQRIRRFIHSDPGCTGRITRALLCDAGRFTKNHPDFSAALGTGSVLRTLPGRRKTERHLDEYSIFNGNNSTYPIADPYWATEEKFNLENDGNRRVKVAGETADRQIPQPDDCETGRN